MKNRACVKVLSIFVILVVFCLSIFTACEPGGILIVDNQRDENTRIIVELVSAQGSTLDDPGKPVDYGIVPANTIKQLASITFVNKEWVHRIEAKDPVGNIVFSHDYNFYDLEKIDWKITILP